MNILLNDLVGRSIAAERERETDLDQHLLAAERARSAEPQRPRRPRLPRGRRRPSPPAVIVHATA